MTKHTNRKLADHKCKIFGKVFTNSKDAIMHTAQYQITKDNTKINVGLDLVLKYRKSKKT